MSEKDRSKVELGVPRPDPNVSIHSMGPRQPNVQVDKGLGPRQPISTPGPRQPAPSAPPTPKPPPK